MIRTSDVIASAMALLLAGWPRTTAQEDASQE